MSVERPVVAPYPEYGKVAPRTFGLIMVKPNAADQVFDPVLAAAFDGDVQPIFEQSGCDFVKELDKVTLCGRYYRDLSTVPYGDTLIQLFYGDKQGRRYFPMISDYYRGRVAFLLLGYNGSQEDFDQFLRNVKGEAETYNEYGELVTAARGVRGALQLSYRHYSCEDSYGLNDEEYRQAFSPVVQNFIHVCDTPREVATAMDYLLTPHDLNELETRGYPVGNFMERNIFDENHTHPPLL